MIAEVTPTDHTARRTVRGTDVDDIARTQFGRGRPGFARIAVSTRYEGHGVWAVLANYGGECTGVIGRIHPTSL